MSPTVRSLGIDRLPVEQRIALGRELWDSIDAEPHPPLLTEPQRQELDRRIADHARNPDDVIPWEQVKRDAESRYRR